MEFVPSYNNDIWNNNKYVFHNNRAMLMIAHEQNKLLPITDLKSKQVNTHINVYFKILNDKNERKYINEYNGIYFYLDETTSFIKKHNTIGDEFTIYIYINNHLFYTDVRIKDWTYKYLSEKTAPLGAATLQILKDWKMEGSSIQNSSKTDKALKNKFENVIVISSDDEDDDNVYSFKNTLSIKSSKQQESSTIDIDALIEKKIENKLKDPKFIDFLKSELIKDQKVVNVKKEK